MLAGSLPDSATDLFSHVTADKAVLYRAILEVFAAAKRQFRLHLRPDEVLADAHWPGGTPMLEEVQAALSQLTAGKIRDPEGAKQRAARWRGFCEH